MVDILHRIGIKAPASRVYDALATVEGVAGWWTDETSGESTKGGTIQVVFRSHGDEKGRMAFEIRELTPGSRVHWRCTAGPAEWIGTDVSFDLATEGGMTVVRFAHRNWREAVDFTAHCSTKWATFLLSLRELVETGAGRPAPHDLKIDDWN